VLGYLATATAATLVACNDDDCTTKDKVILFGVGGIPGGLLGAWLGRYVGGDVELVP
jgi:hypothetical protein